MKEDKRIFDNTKVESHSAIIITGIVPKNGELTEEENKFYLAIKNRFLANFCREECIVNEQTIKIEIENTDFKTK